LDFCLRKPEAGVEVVGGPDGNAFGLIESAPWQGKSYDPRVEAPYLLEEFTRLPPEADAYAHFAAQWGLLGLARYLPEDESGNVEPELGPLETLVDWQRTVLELRTMGELHGALLERNQQEIARIVELDEGWLWLGGQAYASIERLASIDDVERARDRNPLATDSSWAVAPLTQIATAECPDGDLEKAAWDLLAWSINSRTQHLIGYGLRALDPSDPSTLTLQLSPHSQLYAWLWLKLAERVAQGKPMQRCQHCGSWYYQHPEGRRQHGVYCAPRCRVAAWRGRKRGPSRN